MDFGLHLQVQNRACRTLTVFTDSDWAGDRPTRNSVSSWVIMLDGFLLRAGAPTQSLVAQSSCEAEFFSATAVTSEAKYMQALFFACGQRVSTHFALRQHWFHGSGKLKRLATPPSFWTFDFCGCKQKLPPSVFEAAKVPGPENKVANADIKPADRGSLEFCRMSMGVTQIPKQLRDAVL